MSRTRAQQLPLVLDVPPSETRSSRARPARKAPRGEEQLALPGSDVAAPLARVIPFRRRAAVDGMTADAWYARGCELEETDALAAVDAYAQALRIDAAHAATWINVGRLHHQLGNLAAAEAAYGEALDDADLGVVASFNLGVLLEDMRRPRDAAAAYDVACKAGCADAHFNAALLYERLGERQKALRHFMAYKRLAR